ncbi:hypothetical protein JHK87_043156 [Glycine soja]|nr:hypothetical protein JHK87_043156 [Glycine soja]
MAAGESSSCSRDLDQTPTWAVAAVCTVFILVSIALEKSLHKVWTWLGQNKKKALLEALEKVKAGGDLGGGGHSCCGDDVRGRNRVAPLSLEAKS